MRIVEKHYSADGITTKYVLRSGEDFIECTHVNRIEKHIICFSTAVGCPIACVFCCAALFRRRLTADEMVSQCLAVARDANAEDDCKPILFSAMGEGEPMLSEAAAVELSDSFLRLECKVRKSRFAVSTTGVKPHLIRWLADHIRTGHIKLQVSVHGATDAQRARLIPVAAPIKEVVRAASYYEALHPGRVEWNYVLVEGVNDSMNDAHALADLLGVGRKVKLNRLNPVPHRDFRPSTRTAAFAASLEAHGLSTEYYATDGVDVSAACGQLRSRSLPNVASQELQQGSRVPDLSSTF